MIAPVRIALRNIARRPREAALVIIGSMFGTAMLTGAFVIGDSFGQSLRNQALTRLGPIDEVVVATDPQVARELEARVTAVESGDVVEEVRVLRTADAVAIAPDGELVAPAVQLIATDATDEPLAAGTAVITQPLADRLQLAPGDTFNVNAGAGGATVTIAAVTPARGLAGFRLALESAPENIVVAPDTLPALGQPPTALVLAITNRGGVAQTDMAMQELTEALGDLPVVPYPAKQRLLEEADTEGTILGNLLVSAATFGIAAALLLLAGLFVMLAEDRARELGILRALGMRRRPLVGSFVLEGTCYALPAALLGALTGLGLAWVIVHALADAFATDLRGETLALELHVGSGAVLQGVAAGFGASLMTVLATAIVISRRNIVAAIRGVTGAARPPLPRWLIPATTVAALVTLAASIGVIVVGDAVTMLVLPVASALLFTPLLARFLGTKFAITITGAVAIAWSLAFVSIASARDIDLEVTVLAVQGLIVSLVAVVLVMVWQRPLGRALGRLRREHVASRLAFAYPDVRPLRTGLTVGMFAMVSFTVVFAASSGEQFASQRGVSVRHSGGDYNVLATAGTSGVDPAALAADPRILGVAPLGRTNAMITASGYTTERPITVFDGTLLNRDPPLLYDRGEYKTDIDAYRAVLEDPRLVIASAGFIQPRVPAPTRRLHPGDKLTLRDRDSGRELEVTVAAVGFYDYLTQAGWIGPATADALYGGPVAPTSFMIDTASGEEDAVARDLPARFVDRGLEAETVATIVDRVTESYLTFARTLQATQMLGLVAGVAGLAVVMARSVRERRRDIAMTRAIGATGHLSKRSVRVEALFVALQGLLIGTVLGLLVSWLGSDVINPGYPWITPTLPVLVVLAVVLGFVILATIPPARAAAKLDPVTALRLTD